MYEQLKRYIESLVITQGRHAGERFESAYPGRSGFSVAFSVPPETRL